MAKKQAENTNEGQPAAGMPLFYSSPAPLDAQAHAKLGLKDNFGLGFAATANAVPVNIIEMPQICHFYPIAFSPDGNATPVALLGLRDNENLFIGRNGEWQKDTYIPAYIRRYPFIFSEVPDSDQLTLCVDRNEEMVGDKYDAKFFDGTGQATQMAQNALEFCKSYHAAAQATLAFSKALAASGLLVDRQAEVNVGDGRRINFGGFRIIDEEKLNELDDSKFIEWREQGWLPFLYAHLFSGTQWQRLTALLRDRADQ